ncbi:endonuclease/exonuclease/phosphatase family protein [Candidatus Woesebacteria bacterium]|nr:endonuclease/exonuclease/phosphatase family protein [Candidatus Woesebacteria bacterium]
MKIKFINLNIFEGGKFIDAVLAFFKKEQPDILTLQEVYVGKNQHLDPNFRSIKTLQQALPKMNFYFSPEFLHLRKVGNIQVGNAIFSRFPIVTKKTVFFDIPYGEYPGYPKKADFSRDPKNMQLVELNLPHTTLTIGNLHGIWGFDGNDTPRRLAMGKTIIDQIKGKERVIVAGDFNLLPNTKTIHNLEKHLINVFKNELTTTFNMKRKSRPGYAVSVVDMVFVSRDIGVLDKRCPQVDISDHLPLFCLLDV